MSQNEYLKVFLAPIFFMFSLQTIHSFLMLKSAAIVALPYPSRNSLVAESGSLSPANYPPSMLAGPVLHEVVAERRDPLARMAKIIASTPRSHSSASSADTDQPGQSDRGSATRQDVVLKVYMWPSSLLAHDILIKIGEGWGWGVGGGSENQERAGKGECCRWRRGEADGVF
jgi:hypothetical protein